MKALHMIAFILLVVGGLNWGVLALFNTDLGAWLGGGTVAKVIYILVALSAVYEVATHKSRCMECQNKM